FVNFPMCIIVNVFVMSVFCSPNVPHRYHFVNHSKTWPEAQSYCRQTYTDLANINNMDEMKKLNDTLKGKSGNFVWIGLDRGDTGKWWWSLADGSFYSVGNSYNKWSTGDPNNAVGDEFCVAMKKDTTWFDVSCSGPASSVFRSGAEG
uniref:C-type lectin domain-containing protein n=1 Tax=Astyanax mexicanus TaxID=7994 RepID=A0A3B1JF80_ASTMX